MQIGSFDDAAPREIQETGEVEAVAPGIWRLPLPVPFSPGWVNAYLLGDPSSWCLVDCGFGTRACNAALAAGLESLGVRPADLAALVLTHPHPDHIAAAGDISAAMGDHARVIVSGHSPTRLYGVWGARAPAAVGVMAAVPGAAGRGEGELTRGVMELLALAGRMRLPDRATIETVADGETIALGDRAWRVLWTPGHEDGHMTLVSDDIVLAGDHILPTISPNVSLYPQSRLNPIADHLASLDKIAKLDLAAPLALPGHGRPFRRLAERIAELRAGHEQRSAHALAALADIGAPATPLAVAKAIFRGRIRTGIDQRLALGETLAHLEYLRAAGVVTRAIDRSGLLRYQATTPQQSATPRLEGGGL